MIQNSIKQIITIILILFNTQTFFGQSYKIKIEVKGAAGLDAQLAFYQGDNKFVKQTAKFDKNNKVSFEGTDKLPTGIYLIVVGTKGYFDFLIRNEQNFSISTDTADLVRKAKIKDSKENILFFTYQRKVIEYKMQLVEYESTIKKLGNQNDSIELLTKKKEKLNEELNQLVDKTKKENPESYLAKILSAMDVQEIENFDYADGELLLTPFYHNYIRLFIKKNIEKGPAFIIKETSLFLDAIKPCKSNYEYAASYLLNFYNTFYKNGINEVFVFIADNYFLPDKANWISSKDLEQIQLRRDFLNKSMPGNPAQDLTLKSSTGEYISLLQVNSNYTLLYFWSTGCGHCTTSTKILKENYESLVAKGIQIYAVNIEKNEAEWHKKIEENELTWINCIDLDETSNYRDKYYVYGSPLLYVIDSNKKIIAIRNGEVEIENIINQLLK